MENRLKRLIENEEKYNQIIPHTKGFMFDSLVYRFKDYQARAFRAEVLQMKHDKNMTELEASQKVKDRHDRDLIRFIQILDEAIGEHD